MGGVVSGYSHATLLCTVRFAWVESNTPTLQPSGTSQGRVSIQPPCSPKRERTLPLEGVANRDDVLALGAFTASDGGERIFAMLRGRGIQCWDAATGALLGVVPATTVPEGVGVCMPEVYESPDGRTLLRLQLPGKVRVIELETGRELLEEKGTLELHSPAGLGDVATVWRPNKEGIVTKTVDSGEVQYTVQVMPSLPVLVTWPF
jgi:hypothetical protein